MFAILKGLLSPSIVIGPVFGMLLKKSQALKMNLERDFGFVLLLESHHVLLPAELETNGDFPLGSPNSHLQIPTRHRL